jgi:flagellar protein FliJ
MLRRKPFQYETLLRVRQRREDLRAQALADARRNAGRARAQRNRLYQEQQEALCRAGEHARNHFDAGDVRLYYQYERHLAMLGDRKDAEIRELEAAAEEKRKELEAATRERRIMERLRERQNAAYAKYLRQEENKLLDEIAVTCIARNPGHGRAGEPMEQHLS